MATIIKNNGASDWTLSDIDPSVLVPAGQQDDLEALGLSRMTIAMSDQLVTDINDTTLSLVLNDGSRDLTAAEALRHILMTPDLGATTQDKVLRVSVEKADGTGSELITPNWGDNTSWYYKAQEYLGIALSPLASNARVYKPADLNYNGPWVDAFHGKYSKEEFMLTEQGKLPKLKVYEDGVQLTEMDPQWLIDPYAVSPGDFVVDYLDGEIIFHKAPTGVITADVYKVTTSEWMVKPPAGKKWKLDSAEAQFSVGVSMRDQVDYVTYGYVEAFAPTLWDGYNPPGPYPAGTLVPISTIHYKTMMDFINEANGSFPSIAGTTSQAANWRDLKDGIQGFPWNYKYYRVLRSSLGMETRIKLAHDTPFEGHATATLYMLEYDE